MPRDVTEDFPSVDCSALYRSGGLAPGAERERSWVLSASVLKVRTRAAAEHIVVEFGRGWDGPLSQCRIPLERVHTRTYFLCPDCRGRARILYVVAGRVACRQCHALRYPSEGVDDITRNLQGAQRIRDQLGWADGTPRAKPKRMSWKRFLRLVGQHRHYEDKAARLITNLMR